MPDSPTACSVAYFETRDAVADPARRHFAAYLAARAATPGPASFDLLARVGAPGQFALVETGSPDALGNNAAAATLDAALAPQLLAPADRRRHLPLAVAPHAPAATPPAGAIWVLTHVDVVPAHKDSGIARVRGHAETGRAAKGCLGLDAWQQADRPNHITLVEVWSDAPARDAHRASDATRGYRADLAPISGALYDERLYTRLAP